MKCLFFFRMSSMKEGTSAQLSGRGELHGGARVTTLVTVRKCTLSNQREIKTPSTGRSPPAPAPHSCAASHSTQVGPCSTPPRVLQSGASFCRFLSVASDAPVRGTGFSPGRSSPGAWAVLHSAPDAAIRGVFLSYLRRLKLHGIKRQKVPKIQGLRQHQKNHFLACKKSSRF